MTTCDFAACTEPGQTAVDGWVFCKQHARQHHDEFSRPVQAARAAARRCALADERARAAQQAEQDRRVYAAVPHALRLIDAVGRRDRDLVGQVLTQADIPALLIALAAAAASGRNVPPLLQRVVLEPPTGCDPALDSSRGTRAVHGTRSRYMAGCRGAACVEADSVYHAERYKRRKQREHRERLRAES